MSVRVRPLNKVESADGIAWRTEGETIVPVAGERLEGKYTLDHVFRPDTDTRVSPAAQLNLVTS